MNTKQYYTIGAYTVGLMCLALLILIFQTFSVRPVASQSKPMTLAQELRAYRQVLYDIKSSGNPTIPESLKERCDQELTEINALIDSYENGEMEELALRTKFDLIAKQLLNDPYISATKGGKHLLNANLDI
jgi:hypothetical protein